MPRDDWKPLQIWTCNLGLQKGSILHQLIQPGKYMNTFSFIRWPRSRLHGHFYSAPTLKFTGASEPPMGKQRLQWQSHSVGRLCLSFQRDKPSSPYRLYTNGQVALAEQKKSSWKLGSCNRKHQYAVLGSFFLRGRGFRGWNDTSLLAVAFPCLWSCPNLQDHP